MRRRIKIKESDIGISFGVFEKIIIINLHAMNEK